MRVTLKHLIPFVLLLSPVLAAGKDEPTETDTSVAESTSAAPKTTPKVTSTSKGSASQTEDASSTATGDDKDEKKDDKTESKTSSKVVKASQTEQSGDIYTWEPSVPATLAPDLNAGAVSLQDRGFLGFGFALGAVGLGMALL